MRYIGPHLENTRNMSVQIFFLQKTVTYEPDKSSINQGNRRTPY